MKKKVCFFSSEGKEQILQQQYSIQDIRILEEMGFEVIICSKFRDIPFSADLYFGWWAAGSILPLIIAKFVRKPIIVIAGGNETMHYRDSLTNIASGYLATPWYKKLAARLTLEFANEVVVVSKFMEKGIKKITNRPVKVIYNSVDLNTFRPKPESDEYITTISYMQGGHWRIKRIPEFLKAAAIVKKHFPNQKFLILGGQPEPGGLISNLSEELDLNKNIIFLDRMSNKKVATYMNNSLCYVQISDTETFGVAVAEAMSCNIPVIVSRRGALPEIVKNLGKYVDHNDPKSIAAAMLDVIRTKELDNKNLNNSRNWIKNNFSYNKRKTHLSELILNVMNP
ncbi:glycosyltransferase [Gammaproteobacteria bacterium]|nr:glycosyltransferase [Gammaproteobacteria bacterium]